MTDLLPSMAPRYARTTFVLRVDDDGQRGELEIRAAGEVAPAWAVLPARCVRLLLILQFARIEAELTPPDRDSRPTWRRGRPTGEELAARLADLADQPFPIQADAPGTYLRTINKLVADASRHAWPGRKPARLVEQRQGAGLSAPLRIPGLATDPPHRTLQPYVDRYVKSLADPSLADAFRARLKLSMQEAR